MLKRLIFLLPLIFIVACSSSDDSPQEMQEEMEEEEMQETYSFGINVSSDYLSDTETGKVYISNIAGVIVFEADFVNGENYDFSFEAAPGQTFDFTLYRRFEVSGANLYRVTTFEDFIFSSYELDRKDVPPSLEDVSLEYFNFGQPDPTEQNLFYTLTSGSYSSDNGGTLTTSSEQIRNGGSYYMAARNDSDAFPRYFWQESVTAPINVSADFSTLPFADDVMNISFPANDDTRSIVMGHKNYNSNSIENVIRDEISSSKIDEMNIFLKDGLFDFYEVLCSYSMGNRSYHYNELSEGLDFNISNPDFDFSIQNNTIGDFSASTSGNYDNFNARYEATDDTSFNVIYNVVGASGQNISFSKDELFDAIFSNILLISANGLEPKSFGLGNSSSVNSFQDVIQGFLNVSVNTDTLGHTEQSVGEIFQ
ncbi:hypothetical protein POV27_12790 [Aureisphaera galaxeae]|uniref:hypothetical protein n=1 Tax=Aureisphaera galaxeae TaxID=1538023 RepID=UPI0023507848|nr:hypothetical protein [Aureisphaera galaxeae]MDC8004931.1 hypothetical protein [Aureisphaera galaxeae]